MSKKTCADCNGKCCKYVAMEIDIPEVIEDFENIKWYVAHENIHVYIEEDGTWNIEFITKCKYLGKNNKCENYENRPEICKKYGQDECPFHNDYEESYSFRSIEDVEKYIEDVFKKGGGGK